MWKSGFLLRAATLFYKQPKCEKLRLFHSKCLDGFCQNFIHSFSFHIPQLLWKTLQAGVDVCGDIPDVVL